MHKQKTKIRTRFLRAKLLKRYGIHVSSSTKIGIGLTIIHPSTIMITNATIGRNCVLYHNVTIGAKYDNATTIDSPIIGDNVKFYSNSSCYGKIKICDNVCLGSYCVVTTNITKPGTYVGMANNIKRLLK